MSANENFERISLRVPINVAAAEQFYPTVLHMFDLLDTFQLVIAEDASESGEFVSLFTSFHLHPCVTVPPTADFTPCCPLNLRSFHSSDLCCAAH